MLLFIKHIDIEGPGTIETYFEKHGYVSNTIDLGRGDTLPTNFSNIEAIVTLGGPMNVYEEDKYPFLKEEDKFLKAAIKSEIPLLGICLGSQLIAKACDARVVKSPVKEVGWFKVKLNETARQDSLFHGMNSEFDVFHWHEDMFQIPQRGTLLATGKGCPHQAFKAGACAYGIQFHIEVTEPIIADWCKAYLASQDPEKQKKAKDMLAIYQEKRGSFNQQSDIIYKNFAQIISKRKVLTAKG